HDVSGAIEPFHLDLLIVVYARGGYSLLATEQVEDDGNRHQPDDAVAAQRGHQLQHVADNVTEEGDIGAEQHLQHDAESDEQEAQLCDLGDPGFGPVEQFHQLFLRLPPRTGSPRRSFLTLEGDYAGTTWTTRGMSATRNSHQAIVIRTQPWRKIWWGWS